MADQQEAAARWFLSRGLPAVLRPSALVHRAWSRSAPALAALAVVALNSTIVVAVSGQHTVDISGRPDLPEGVVLALLAVMLPVAALASWLVSKIEPHRARVLAADIAAGVIALGAVFGGPGRHTSVNVMIYGIAVAVILLMTVTGVGSILGWAARMTLTNLALARGMFVRALPVVLLTFLVFFNTYVWLMTSLISRTRLWVGMCFLLLIAGSFLVSSTLAEVRRLADAPDAVASDSARLAGTPFADVADPTGDIPITTLERLNAVFVVTASQMVHVLTVALMTGAVFFVLGMILVSPEVLDAWTRGNGRPDGQLLGMTLPIPDSLIQTSMLLTAITFMYLAAKAVTDAQYRSQFLDPIVDDVRLNLVAMRRYEAMQGAAAYGDNVADQAGNDVFGKRYGEVLLLRMGDSGPEATVYNTFPLNDCPADLWDALDAAGIAKDNDALAALLNGPRYWLMSRIGKRAGEPQPTKTFGGIEMIEQATVQLSSNDPQPYSVNTVDRRAAFTFGAGRPVFELVDPDGRRWVMQTYSQVVDKNLTLDDLAGLGSRLALPDGWRYESRTLTEPLVVDTTERPASVLQDDLTNSYSLQN